MVLVSVVDFFNLTGTGTVLLVTVKAGVLRKGMRLSLGGNNLEIISIGLNSEMLDEVKEGGVAGIHLKVAGKTSSVKEKTPFMEKFFRPAPVVIDLVPALKKFVGHNIEFV